MSEEINKVNSPKKFVKEVRERYLELLAGGARRGAAAKAVGMCRTGVWRYIKNHPGFQKEVAFAEMQANEQVEDALFQAAISGNVIAIQVWLYNRWPERWKDRRNLRAEISGPEGQPVVFKIITAIPSPEDSLDDDDSAPDPDA